jgi:hypothetical protein
MKCILVLAALLAFSIDSIRTPALSQPPQRMIVPWSDRAGHPISSAV